MQDDLYEINVTSIDGQPMSMDRFRGKVLLIVNVASQCGYTPQYEGLEALYQKYRDAGFVVLGFPCNQFGAQEPGSEREIAQFCRTTYGVTFPMFGKVNVNGDEAHPLFKWLKARRKGILWTEAIKWNFTKFLVDRSGVVLSRFGPTDTPEAIDARVAAEVAETRRGEE